MAFEEICHALADIATTHQDIQISMQYISTRTSESRSIAFWGMKKSHSHQYPGVLPFVWLMNHRLADFDRLGGVREEAPSLGKPVLVMRDTTERAGSGDGGYGASGRHG
ncbi:UDP-N-acetylglucosamine 2-epimerase [Escherichia coli]